MGMFAVCSRCKCVAHHGTCRPEAIRRAMDHAMSQLALAFELLTPVLILQDEHDGYKTGFWALQNSMAHARAWKALASNYRKGLKVLTDHLVMLPCYGQGCNDGKLCAACRYMHWFSNFQSRRTQGG